MYICSFFPFCSFFKEIVLFEYTNQVAQNFKNFSLGLFFVDALAKSCLKQNLSECSQH